MNGLAAKLALLAGITISSSAWASDVLCPLPVGGPDKKEAWKLEYLGPLTRVGVSSVYADIGIKSFVMCQRSVGRMTLTTARRCRLIAGMGTVKVVEQTRSSEVQWCDLNMDELNNEKDCVVECE
jgi:hypothetical protein